MQKNTYILLAIMLGALTACGGSGSSSSSGQPEPIPEPINVALPSNGGSTEATYNQEIAYLVNDGEAYLPDTGAPEQLSESWQGNIPGDSVTVIFDQPYRLTELTLYVSPAVPVYQTDLPWVTISEDGDDFVTFDLRENCEELWLRGAYRIECTLEEPVEAKALRLSTQQETNPHQFRVAEVEVWGY